MQTYDTTNQYAQSPAEQEAGYFCVQTEEQEFSGMQTGGNELMGVEITWISRDELRHMEGSEGLILQGCGGDLTEWVDGMNQMGFLESF